MNIEAYSYTVLSSILGIAIVFAFLGFLCLLMVVIKQVFDKKPEVSQIVIEKESPGGVKTAETDESDWITAAVAAYLDEEDSPRSAMSWQPAENEKSDPWVSTPRVQKIFSGV